MNRERENPSDESYLLTYLLSYLVSQKKCGFVHILEECVMALVYDDST